jgi:UDP-glucose 4,6-dehydratase
MSFGLPIMITRSNNVYGPYQFPEKITSKFVCSLLRGKKCYIHGDGHNSRKYLYAADVVNAIDIIFHKGHVGETYNIGSPSEISNLEMAKRLILLFGYKEEEINNHIEFVRDRAFNDTRYAIDCTKLEKLGWEPKVEFEEGLLKTSTSPTLYIIYIHHNTNHYFFKKNLLVEWYRNCTESWWGDISSALIPHPFKVIPSYNENDTESTVDEE